MTNEELFRLGAYETLYTRNLPFMYSLAKRFNNLPIEIDDLIGCGDIAFAKSLKKYNPDTSKWLTYFSKLMINEILMANRKATKHMQCISLETIIIMDDGGTEIKLEHQISTGPPIEDEVMDRVTVKEILELTTRLPQIQRDALRLYLLGKKQREIGEKLNVSQAQVSRLIKKIAKRLCKQYAKGA